MCYPKLPFLFWAHWLQHWPYTMPSPIVLKESVWDSQLTSLHIFRCRLSESIYLQLESKGCTCSCRRRFLPFSVCVSSLSSSLNLNLFGRQMPIIVSHMFRYLHNESSSWDVTTETGWFLNANVLNIVLHLIALLHVFLLCLLERQQNFQGQGGVWRDLQE